MIQPGTPPQPHVTPVGRPRRRRWPWVLGVLMVLSLGCCGLLTVVTEPIRDQWPVRAVLDTEIAGLHKDPDPELQALERELVEDVRAQNEHASAIGAKLDDPKAKGKWLLLVVITKLILDPSGKLDRHMALVGDGTLRNVQDFDAGPRGGHFRCAETDDKAGNKVVVCGWIDHGSVGVAVFYGGRPIADSARLMQEIRTEILVKA
ncbi:hypothetical protein [Catellatospora bangladeshensis]|uniref:hypothetical protein n=1 Tax=Catellatospora bangladeshensis TaxID=310355 RepID=UPI0019443088|nr:hypothetical protein [Catellatospora bangladeshensis]